jgi:hypothetical protein
MDASPHDVEPDNGTDTDRGGELSSETDDTGTDEADAKWPNDASGYEPDPAKLGLPCMRKRGELTRDGSTFTEVDRYAYEKPRPRVLSQRLDKGDDGMIDATSFRKYTRFGKIETWKRDYLGDEQWDVVWTYTYSDGHRLSRESWDSDVDGIDEIAERHDATPYQIALAWLLGHSDVTLPIPGTSSLDHLEQNVAASAIELSDEELARLS